jgi:hypothetical protein
MSSEFQRQQDTVRWVGKIAREDWSAFHQGEPACIVAVVRKRLWDRLIAECETIIASYEREYVRRVCWITESLNSSEDEQDKIVYKASLVELGRPDRTLFELRFDTDLSGIYFYSLTPFKKTGVVTFALLEEDDVKLCYRRILMEPVQLAKFLLAPVLFRLHSFHARLAEDLAVLAGLREAYANKMLSAVSHVQIPSPALDAPPGSAALEIRGSPQAKKGETKQNWLRYAFAAVPVLVATAVLFFFQSLTPVPIYWLLSGAIALAFVQWGIGPGIVALVIGVLATDYFFVEPIFQITFDSTTRLFGIGYALTAFTAYWLSERRRQGHV